MTLAVGIAHAAWSPGRKETLTRLLSELQEQGCTPYVQTSEKKEPASVWAVERLWGWAESIDDDVLLLNDDVEVHPRLLAACRAILANPKTSRMISLHTNIPAAASLARAGERFVRSFLLSGPAYLLRRGVARDLRRMIAAMPPAFVQRSNEDNLAIQCAYRLREPIACTIPSLVVHDVGVASTLGYDNHPQRQSPVPWTLFPRLDVLDWETEDEPPFVECQWMPVHALNSTEIALSLGILPVQCWSCLEQVAPFGSSKSGLRICGKCLHDYVGGVIGTATRAMAKAEAAPATASVLAAIAAETIAAARPPEAPGERPTVPELDAP